MKVIALTGDNEAAMQLVCIQLLEASSARGLDLSVLVGIEDARAAEIVFRDKGELWRVGVDETKPELDLLVDRWINDAGALASDVDVALERFLSKAWWKARHSAMMGVRGAEVQHGAAA